LCVIIGVVCNTAHSTARQTVAEGLLHVRKRQLLIVYVMKRVCAVPHQIACAAVCASRGTVCSEACLWLTIGRTGRLAVPTCECVTPAYKYVNIRRVNSSQCCACSGSSPIKRPQSRACV